MKKRLKKLLLKFAIPAAALLFLVILLSVVSAFGEYAGLQKQQTAASAASDAGTDAGAGTVNETGNVTGQPFSNNLVKSIESWESFSAVGYRGEDYWNVTIGYGHVEEPGEYFTTLTQPEAEQLLISDLQLYSASVTREFAGTPLSQNEYDALTDLAFGFGTNIWPSISLTQDVKSGASSDVLKRDFECLDHVGGEESPGLLRRLDAEWLMFTQDVYVLNS